MQMEQILIQAVTEWRQAKQNTDERLERVRQVVREAYAAGLTRTEIHRITGVSRTAINDWIGFLRRDTDRSE